jgi:hypothetical protein
MKPVGRLTMAKKIAECPSLFAFKTGFGHPHFHLLMDALARLPSPALAAIGAILAQNDALRPLSASVRGLGAGAFSLEPVARL